jgi:thiol-disulfide isomerase/thioredoxin
MAERLSKKALQIILSGKVKEDAAVAVKFYSNGCHYCHSLKDAYEDLADEFDEEVFFYAFNVEDYPEIENILNFRGVPTICFMKTGSNPRIRLMSEPEEPNDDTWYEVSDIRKFIDEQRRKSQ